MKAKPQKQSLLVKKIALFFLTKNRKEYEMLGKGGTRIAPDQQNDTVAQFIL